MMGLFVGEEEDRFFDSRDSSFSESDLDSLDGSESNRRSFKWVSTKLDFQIWMRSPASVRERRDKFLKTMDLGVGTSGISIDVERVTMTSDAMSRNSDFEEEFVSSRSSISSRASNAGDVSTSRRFSVEDSSCRIKNLDDGTEFVACEMGRDGMLDMLCRVGSNRLFTIDESQRTLGLSPTIQQAMRRDETQGNVRVETVRRRRMGWLRRLGAAVCVVDRQSEEGRLDSRELDSSTSGKGHKIKVRSHKKRSKELSALCVGQEIKAHEGSILTMKFSPDGQYLASAGEDGIVRVWQVMECERTDGDMPKLDPSCVCFTVNSSLELSPLLVDKEKMNKHSSMTKTEDSACVILPYKIFKISENPIHEFHGHSANVLDLCWSKNKYLLSASEDKTVRLWQLGCSRCLKVFTHSNYVTGVSFNPVADDHFVSVSIDGKVRIWAIPSCYVVDWTDIKDIATAVCYRPDGQGIIVGSMTGDCRFYGASGNQLNLEAQVCLQSRKKSRVIQIQFSPTDHGKVMVTSADSQIRILDGIDIIYKYRGVRSSGNQISASFTSDGRHIISVSEDSNVCMWNHNSSDGPLHSHTKSIYSCERFISCNASVAIPWFGVKPESFTSNEQVCGDTTESSDNVSYNGRDSSHSDLMSLFSQNNFLLNHDFFSESLPKGSATWPEEKLPTSSSHSPPSSMCKSQYRFLKTSYQNTVSSHAWGLVIVTAGLDGRIRSFCNYGLPIRL